MEKREKVSLILCIAVIVLLVATIVLEVVNMVLIVTSKDKKEEQQQQHISNVILLIGDGMGFNHLEQTKKAFDLNELEMEKMNAAKCTTDSVDGSTQYIGAVTDSAAGATALATGYKTVNGRVARSAQNEKTVLKSIMQFAQEEDKMTAVITTDNPYGATPSGFSSNSTSRTDYKNLLTHQFKSEIDLIVGGVYEGDGGDRTTARVEEIEDNGYTYITDYEALLKADSDDKIYSVLPTLHSQYTGEKHVELADVTKFALDYLSQDEDGFMMMVEGARIDKYSHDNDMDGMVNELRDFDETVAACVEWASRRDDTVVIVTADHETGGITLTPQNEYVFNTTNHTGTTVPLFYYGVTLDEAVYDNTDVFKICLSLCQTGKYEG